ncbi:MAG TPA: SpoIIE family protein phosphatase, partial [Leptospiraceae bacterium]|nr:SpoIIE family protein phosphatase [Leptospiraceae bacterium]HNE25331.1 SpoIIE family protein phosphatase [Leptospiraceae bacterium]
WEAEIGGDLATANVITLRGRRYAVFINGDAMGKSIQGAGGALVLGTVFKSILSRTQVSSYFQNRYPEQWLKEMFLELQSVFTAFDGSMMVSAVFGLVSEESGLVYYVNAEHPFVVLYRRGKASFLDRSMELRKLGIAIIPGILQVRSVPLRPRDVLIIGSDGRDDVAIGEDSLGNRIINEDESHFLRSVEKGDGNLERIEEAIRETGELTDDLSLMRIAFRDDVPLTEESSVDQARDRIAVARAHARSGRLRQAEEDYRAAAESSPGPAIGREWLKVLHAMGRESERAEIAERYSELHPEVPGFLRVASEALAACGNIEKAVDFGERYRLCQPYNRAGLLHLVDLHMRQGRWTAALRVVEQRLIVDPMDREALELRLLLRQKMGSDDA